MWRLFMSEGARHEGKTREDHHVYLVKTWTEVRILGERDVHGRFVKGHKASVGNAGGRPKVPFDAKEKIKELGMKGLDVIDKMLDDPETDTATRARLAIFCTEKAYGKAKQEIENNSARTGMTDSIIEAVKRIE